MTQHSLLFLHVPKTAGMTLRRVVTRQFNHKHIYTIGEDINGDIIQFRQWSNQHRFQYRAMQGHMSFGLHAYMQQPSHYITVLREPVKRAISDYRFITSNRFHSVYHIVKDMTLSDFITSQVNGQISNGQTRLISGDHQPDNPGIPSMREMRPNDLEAAKTHLHEHFIVTGIQEKFDESLILFRQHLGWRFPFYIKVNVTRKIDSHKPVSASEIELIKSRNQLDIELYEFAECCMRRQIENSGDKFKRDLSLFRVLNYAYQNAGQLSWRQQRARLGNIARRLGLK